MARKSLIEREKKRQKLVKIFQEKRASLKELLKKAKFLSLDEKLEISSNLQKLPKNSAPGRLRNRCWKTGKPRGYFRFFGICRNVLREMAHSCLLPGVTKSSW
jgi:small subunit ribosomal protein S14